MVSLHGNRDPRVGINWGVDGGSPCPMSITRNGNVALSFIFHKNIHIIGPIPYNLLSITHSLPTENKTTNSRKVGYQMRDKFYCHRNS